MTPTKITLNKDGSSTYEKEETLKSKGEDHICIKEEIIAIIKTRQDKVIETLVKIDESLKGLDKKSDGLLIEITDVHSKLSIFKAEVTGKEAGLREAESKKLIADGLEATRKRDRNWRYATFISIFIAVVGLTFTAIKLFHGQEQIVQKVDNMGEPVILNNRGQTLSLPPDVKLRFLYKDYADSLRQDSILKSNK
jgi:hypothetical protein